MKISGHAGTCNIRPAKADQLPEVKVEAEFTNLRMKTKLIYHIAGTNPNRVSNWSRAVKLSSWPD
jgi:hypothetical protein